MPKMDLSSLRAVLDSERASALSSNQSGKLSIERQKAMDYYMGNMANDMPAADGRSSAISSDVADTVEGLMPDLMEIFVGGDEVVRFQPVDPDDVDAADQETDYVNHVFMHQNPGFMTVYSFIKDALLQKVGVIKVAWDVREEETEETYNGLDDQTFDMLVNEEGVEVVEHTAYPMTDPSPSETPSTDSAVN